MPALAALQRRTALAGAILLLIGYATGGLLAAAQTGKIDADAPTIAAGHLNAILGCFWLAALAFTVPMLRFDHRKITALCGITTLAAYANWLITIAKSFFHVKGVGYEGHAANDIVFVALNLFVVLPSLASVGGWIYGLSGKAPTSPAE